MLYLYYTEGAGFMKSIKNKLFVLNYVGSLLLILATFLPIIKFNNQSFAFIDQFFYLSFAIVILSTAVLILTTAKKYKWSLIPTILCAGIIVYGIYTILNIDGLKTMQNISYGIAFIVYPIGFVLNLIGGIFTKNIDKNIEINKEEISENIIEDNLNNDAEAFSDFDNSEQIPLNNIINANLNETITSDNDIVDINNNFSENIEEINIDNVERFEIQEDIINEIKSDDVVLEQPINNIPETQNLEIDNNVDFSLNNDSSNYEKNNINKINDEVDVNDINFEETMKIIDEIENSDINNNQTNNSNNTNENIFSLDNNILDQNNMIYNQNDNIEPVIDEEFLLDEDENPLSNEINDNQINSFEQINTDEDNFDFSISDNSNHNEDEIKNIEITPIIEDEIVQSEIVDENSNDDEIFMVDIESENNIENNVIVKNENLEIPDLDIENDIMTNNTQIEEKVEQNFMAINPSDIKIDEKKVLFKKKEKKEEDPLQKIMNRNIPRTLERNCQFCSTPLGDDERICPLCGRIN